MEYFIHSHTHFSLIIIIIIIIIRMEYSTINLKALSHIIKYFFDVSSTVQMENLGIKSNFVNCIEHLRMNTFYLLHENFS